jgi:hypothetical protein
MPSDDAPFIIESDEELPTGRGKSVGMRLQDTLRGRGWKSSEAHMKMPLMTCQNFTPATAKHDINV